MELKESFAELERVRLKFGAPVSKWRFDDQTLGEREKVRLELQRGIELTLDKVQTIDGLFTHKGEQVVIYIKDHSKSFDARDDISRRRKVHLVECETIREMRAVGRYDRYVATTRRDDLYRLDLPTSQYSDDVEEMERKLEPCINCLKVLNYQGAADTTQQARRELRRLFTVATFFECYSTFFVAKPRYTDHSAPIARYVADWWMISSRARDAARWTCSKCQVQLSDPVSRKFLHVHHRNGQPGDNSPANLEVLCALCHAAEPGHGHMFVSSEARVRIESLRNLKRR